MDFPSAAGTPNQPRVVSAAARAAVPGLLAALRAWQALIPPKLALSFAAVNLSLNDSRTAAADEAAAAGDLPCLPLTLRLMEQNPAMQEQVADYLSSLQLRLSPDHAAAEFARAAAVLPQVLSDRPALLQALDRFICQCAACLTDRGDIAAGLKLALQRAGVEPEPLPLRAVERGAAEKCLQSLCRFLKEALSGGSEDNAADALPAGFPAGENSATPAAENAAVPAGSEEADALMAERIKSIINRAAAAAKKNRLLPPHKTKETPAAECEAAAAASATAAAALPRSPAADLFPAAPAAQGAGGKSGLQYKTVSTADLTEPKSRTQPAEKKQAVPAGSAKTEAAAPAMTLAQLSARAAQVQQHFREDRRRQAEEGRLPNPATPPQVFKIKGNIKTAVEPAATPAPAAFDETSKNGEYFVLETLIAPDRGQDLEQSLSSSRRLTRETWDKLQAQLQTQAELEQEIDKSKTALAQTQQKIMQLQAEVERMQEEARQVAQESAQARLQRHQQQFAEHQALQAQAAAMLPEADPSAAPAAQTRPEEAAAAPAAGPDPAPPLPESTDKEDQLLHLYAAELQRSAGSAAAAAEAEAEEPAAPARPEGSTYDAIENMLAAAGQEENQQESQAAPTEAKEQPPADPDSEAEAKPAPDAAAPAGGFNAAPAAAEINEPAPAIVEPPQPEADPQADAEPASEPDPAPIPAAEPVNAEPVNTESRENKESTAAAEPQAAFTAAETSETTAAAETAAAAQVKEHTEPRPERKPGLLKQLSNILGLTGPRLSPRDARSGTRAKLRLASMAQDADDESALPPFIHQLQQVLAQPVLPSRIRNEGRVYMHRLLKEAQKDQGMKWYLAALKDINHSAAAGTAEAQWSFMLLCLHFIHLLKISEHLLQLCQPEQQNLALDVSELLNTASPLFFKDAELSLNAGLREKLSTQDPKRLLQALQDILPLLPVYQEGQPGALALQTAGRAAGRGETENMQLMLFQDLPAWGLVQLKLEVRGRKLRLTVVTGSLNALQQIQLHLPRLHELTAAHGLILKTGNVRLGRIMMPQAG